MMNFTDLLIHVSIDPSTCIIMRHSPTERSLRRVLPWLAAEKPGLYDAYQQTQGATLESSLLKVGLGGRVASFVAHGSGKALLAGIYAVDGFRPLNYKQYWAMAAHRELNALGMDGWSGKDGCKVIQWIEMNRTNDYAEWQGKLVIDWPIGSACGEENILGRWNSYATSGHGGNKLLRDRNPANFTFSILQRVSPDETAEDVLRIENSWKNRLFSAAPNGLNSN